MRKFALVMMVCTAAICFVGCGKNTGPSEKNKKATINSVCYQSLTEAVENAKEGDTIKVYDDLIDHKNIVLNKPIKIEGVLGSNKVKPKVYGSITIDLSGEEDSVDISDIDLIHDGVNDEGLNNDTRVGVNVIDGGLKLQNCKISVMEGNDAPEAVGVILSRKAGSKNIMPFVIKGNSIDSYPIYEGKLNAAMIIKSNKDGEFQKLDIDAGKIYDDNSFAHCREANQMISIDYGGGKIKYPYFVSSSCDEMLSALKDRQDSSGSVFRLSSFNPPKVMTEGKFYVDSKTSLSFEGNAKPTLEKITFVVSGSLVAEKGLDGAEVLRNGNTSYVVCEP